jgi:sialate O-acetylesterase
LIDLEPPSGLVHSFDMTDHWLVAREPLHRLVDALDSFHWRGNPTKERLTGDALRDWMAKLKKGAGLGLPFAAEMARRTGVPIGLIPCAHGGTSMDQWSPDLKDQGGASLYGGMLRRFRAIGGKVAGLLWYQGESEANPEAAAAFRGKFERFVASVRQDFGQPDLPFYYVQIGRFIITDNPEPWNKVQQMQLEAESTIPRAGMVAAIDLTLDDLIHVGAQDLKRLGRRLATLAIRDLFP